MEHRQIRTKKSSTKDRKQGRLKQPKTITSYR